MAGKPELAGYHALFLTKDDLPTLRVQQDARDDRGAVAPDRSFDRCRGLASGFMWWMGGDADVLWSITDSRWVFPDADNAAAYFQASLADQDLGGLIVPMAVPHVGEECVVLDHTTWADVFMPPIKLEALGYRFRVGNVVASVQVGAGPDTPEGTLKLVTVTALATVAANRIEAAIQ